MKTALKLLQWFSFALLLLIVLTFVLAILGRVPWGVFWILAALIALCAYVLIPRVRAVLLRHS